MAVYELLGTKVAFSDAEERFLDLFYKEQRVTAEVKARYQSWYKQAGSIEYVLNNLMTFEGRTIGEVVLQPLFQELAQYEIYDIGWDAYIQDCAHFPNMQQAGQRLQDQYDEIEHQRQAEAAYRENRKASRSRWSGGGFGLDRKSTRLNSSHVSISYAVFCLKKKKEQKASVKTVEYGRY